MAGTDTRGRVRRLVERTALGYRIAPSAERSAVEALTASAITAGLDLLMIHPLSRSRRIGYVFGPVLISGSTIAAFLTRNHPREPPLGIPLGIGAAIIFPGRKAAFNHAAASVLATTALAADLHRRGAIHEAVRQLAAG